jgi:hypothetical protein
LFFLAAAIVINRFIAAMGSSPVIPHAKNDPLRQLMRSLLLEFAFSKRRQQTTDPIDAYAIYTTPEELSPEILGVGLCLLFSRCRENQNIMTFLGTRQLTFRVRHWQLGQSW